MNEQEPMDEIESYELNDEDFNSNLAQYARNSTLVNRFGSESPELMDESFFKNRKPSIGWLADSQQQQQDKIIINQKQPRNHRIEDETNYITELDVNSSDHLTEMSELSILDGKKEEDGLSLRTSRKNSTISMRRKSSQNLINDLPTLLDQDDLIEMPDFIGQNALSIEQLDNITKKESTAIFMLDNINLSILTKFLTKDDLSMSNNSINELEKDVNWNYESLITEMNDYFKNL